MIRLLKPGTRVGAILSADDKTVHLLGYGVYDGDFKPPVELFFAENPRITLDNGSVVWGYQCWWGAEEQIRASIGERTIVAAKVPT